ncbi:ABC transporter [Enhydrobacter aerosaccus]|uniref:ABC transporter n=1 Tax=Enhydrobacter aerosaccus TaxID=225324 RepID=A0ABR5IL21_9HYPH|nr:AAA family ATPase [Enhydrobacter aerosaccus]KND21687.1 ABC transporter [Enhydrobacter aerosaccus]
MNTYEKQRGSVWTQWDLHIHTPASFHWEGKKFNGEKEHDDALIDAMIEALNKAEPTVFALMDYWTFDGWFKLKERLKESDAPKLEKVVFPGIELRLVAPMEGRLNAHVIFSNEIENQELIDFKSVLQVALIDKALSETSLKALARQVGADKLIKHGFKKQQVDSSDEIALLAGCTIAEITTESYKSAISKVSGEQAIGFMPFDTNDGLAEVKWFEHYSYAMALFQSSPIFETRDFDKRCAFVGEKTEGNKRFFDNFQSALKNIHRLAVSGSDAHRFIGIKSDNDKRGYGDFPSNKKTWIKAEQTFQGLKQAILEPAKRSFIGEKPPKLIEVESNKTYYIESLKIDKTGSKTTIGQWLHGSDIPLNPDLTAIIGNKGSGKSALADILALLGNSRQSSNFSFLKKDRFYGKSGEPANQFTGTLTWLDGSTEPRKLNETVPEEKAEKVRYIPQNYFEGLCTDHVSGKSEAFENELREVIFSHVSDEMRLDALSFDQLVDKQELSLRNKLGEYRKDLSNINEKIVRIEEQLQPIEKEKIHELILLKTTEIEEHNNLKPQEVPPPALNLTEEQQQIQNQINDLNLKIQTLEERERQGNYLVTVHARKIQSIANIQEQLRLLERAFKQAEINIKQDLQVLDIKWNDLAKLEIDFSIINEKSESLNQLKNEAISNKQIIEEQLRKENTAKQELTSKLDAPQQEFEAYQLKLSEWQEKYNKLNGGATEPDTLEGLKARIEQIDNLPQELQLLKSKRIELSMEIFDTLNQQRLAREKLFKPVQELIQDNALIREDYQLQFLATLATSPEAIADKLFSMIKQNAGEFRGQDESLSVVKRLFDLYDLNTKAGVKDFVTNLTDKIENTSNLNHPNSVGIQNILKLNHSAKDVYDLIFGLDFLEPRYSLLFQQTPIEQLSPGQRGALLLIFYLLVDKGKMPIILDQPEENLDNQTVYHLLVPVVSEAKRSRQIIMVTHNPNLAVVCDAEQIIYSDFDRANNFKITYTSGSIENPEINDLVVKVLEGTRPAFNNRSGKYY